MIASYLKVAYRTLTSHFGNTVVNVVSLSASMAVCLLIIAFVADQWRHDRFHAAADHIVRVVAHKPDPSGTIIPVAATPAPLADELERTAPGVVKAVQIRELKTRVEHSGAPIGIRGFYADADFFELFDFPLAAGSPQKALTRPNTIVLSRGTAATLFGETDPMGKTLVSEDGSTFTVTGVLGEARGSSHLKFDALASMVTVQAWPQERAMLDDWHNYYSYYTYLLLKDDASAAMLSAQLPGVIERHYPKDEHELYTLGLQQLTAISLGDVYNNEIGFIVPAFIAYVLGALALLIMLTAVFNYVGLTVARSVDRVREVGVRKVLGARRIQVVGQFVTEATLVALLALAGAVVLLLWLVPAFNGLWFVQMAQTPIRLDPKSNLLLHALFVVFALGVGVVAGLFPALHLSRHRPAQALRGGTTGHGSGRRLRNTLVVAQFAMSVLLVVTVAVLYGQLRYMTNADYGFDADHVVNVALGEVDYDTFRQEALKAPGVINVSATSKLPASGSVSGVWLNHSSLNERLRAYEYAVDDHFVDNMGLTFVAGRGFAAGERPAGGVLLNETAVRTLGLGTPSRAVGEAVTIDGNTDRIVLGVVQDFQFDLLDAPVRPLLLTQGSVFRYANVRVVPGTVGDATEQLRAIWEQLGTSRAFTYQIYSEQLANTPLNIVFRDIMRVVGLAALLAALIACMGLMATAAFSARARTKEVGVRKVLGAGIADVVFLLSKDLLKLLAVAVVLAVPLAWIFNRLWLQSFAHHIDLGPGLLAASTGLLLTLALATVGSQTVRAALADPVESLRSE